MVDVRINENEFLRLFDDGRVLYIDNNGYVFYVGDDADEININAGLKAKKDKIFTIGKKKWFEDGYEEQYEELVIIPGVKRLEEETLPLGGTCNKRWEEKYAGESELWRLRFFDENDMDLVDIIHTEDGTPIVLLDAGYTSGESAEENSSYTSYETFWGYHRKFTSKRYTVYLIKRFAEEYYSNPVGDGAGTPMYTNKKTETIVIVVHDKVDNVVVMYRRTIECRDCLGGRRQYGYAWDVIERICGEQ